MTLVMLAMAAVLGMQETPAEAIDRFIRDLGSNDVEMRETAGGELRKMGAAAVPALRKAVGDATAGRAERAAKLIEEIEKGGAPQDAKQDPRDAAAVANVANALRKTAAGSYAFTGEVVSTSTEGPQAGAEILKMLGRSKGEPLSGKLAGAVAAPFRAAAFIKTAGGGYDVFHEDDRTFERLTCRVGTIEAPLDAASQVLFVLNLEQLAKSVETLATRVRGGADSKGRKFEISLPEDAIPSIEAQEDDPVAAAFRKSTAPERTVDVVVWPGNDGQVQRLQAVFHYKQKNNGRGFTGDVNFNMTLQEYGTAKVEIPADVKEE